MAKRTRVSTGTPFEIKFRYSRAVRVGDLVFVSGTTAMKDGAFVGVSDAGAQTRQILANIVWALGQAGASANDVVRNGFTSRTSQTGPRSPMRFRKPSLRQSRPARWLK
jgi:enamine deaminase RidA (YjgF/YER057c/UK114 family)